MTGIQTTTRNADLPAMIALLKDQQARSLDLVASPAAFRVEHGRLVVDGAEPIVGEDGVTDPNGVYDVSAIADEGIAQKLGCPIHYLRWMRENRVDLYDANVNGLLHGGVIGPADPTEFAGYGKNLMLRLLRGDDTGTGVARAVLSDRYGIIDNLDVLVASLKGVREAGIDGQVTRCDLTERRMHVVVEAPQIAQMAPVLLDGYRDPFRPGGVQRIRELAAREGLGYEPGTEPVIHAGVKITNSETGNGGFSISPHLVVRICRNGYTVTADQLRRVHLAGRLDEGTIRWSHDTTRKALELVASQTKDAVASFLSGEYLAAQVAKISTAATTPVTDAPKTIAAVAKAATYSAELADEILACFTAGGQLTAGGVMHAVTAAAQMVPDADTAAAMEAEALDALAIAARMG